MTGYRDCNPENSQCKKKRTSGGFSGKTFIEELIVDYRAFSSDLLGTKKRLAPFSDFPPANAEEIKLLSRSQYPRRAATRKASYRGFAQSIV